jgi:hypothetical protein
MFRNILAPGAWQQLGTAPVQAGVNLGYTFSDRRLNLTINEATLQTPEQQANSIALFSGNFDYDLAETIAPTAYTKTVKRIVTNWQQDLDLYKQVIDQFMLSEAVISFPALSQP